LLAALPDRACAGPKRAGRMLAHLSWTKFSRLIPTMTSGFIADKLQWTEKILQHQKQIISGHLS
jgi:hypothetical protein